MLANSHITTITITINRKSISIDETILSCASAVIAATSLFITHRAPHNAYPQTPVSQFYYGMA